MFFNGSQIKQLGFIKDVTQLDELVPRLRLALRNATGGTGKASDVNFARLQAELDDISRENKFRFSAPPFFTVIIRSLTILEGVAFSVDKNFRLVRGSYPYVLNQLLTPEDDGNELPDALEKLLIRLLTVDGEQKEIEWDTLRALLKLAQKASKKYDPSTDNDDTEDERESSRNTIGLLVKFMSSSAGVILKKPLVHELAQAVDSMASMGEANLFRQTRGLLPLLPGMNGPINNRRIEEMGVVIQTFRDALLANNSGGEAGSSDGSAGEMRRMEAIMQIFRDVSDFVRDERIRQDTGPLLEEIQSVIQMVAVEVLEIRGSRAFRSLLQVSEA